MRRFPTPRPTPRPLQHGPIDADGMIETARSLASVLPALAEQAEAGGLQLVAQHLDRALQLARRVASAGAAPPAGRPSD